LVVLTLINFVFPIGILFGFPRIINNEHPTWSFVILALPDIGYFCIIVSGLFMIMGLLKTIYFLVYMKTSQYKKSLQDSKDDSNE
jgi:hypothetical protein